jgi:hypothetical protein
LVENISQEIESYLDVTENIVYQYQELDIFNLYDGEITDTDYLDSDWVDDEIQSIYEK